MENCKKKIKEIIEFEKIIFSKFCDIIKVQGRLYTWKLLYIEYRTEGVIVTGKCFEDANGQELEIYFSIEDLEKTDNEWTKHVLEIKRNKEEHDKKIQRRIDGKNVKKVSK